MVKAPGPLVLFVSNDIRRNVLIMISQQLFVINTG